MRKSPAESQRFLPAMEVPRPERSAADFRSAESRDPSRGSTVSRESAFRQAEADPGSCRGSEPDSYDLAAELFRAALADPKCNLTIKEVAHLLGVSTSLVEKWARPGARACPSFAQMLRLPLRFHLALRRAMDRRFGFSRAALLDLLEAAGALALAVGE